MADDASDLIDVSIAQDGGVKKRILQEAPEGAEGPPPKGYEVTAHYTGKYHSQCYPRVVKWLLLLLCVCVGGSRIYTSVRVSDWCT
jgi:hypothetical protein